MRYNRFLDRFLFSEENGFWLRIQQCIAGVVLNLSVADLGGCWSKNLTHLRGRYFRHSPEIFSVRLFHFKKSA